MDFFFDQQNLLKTASHLANTPGSNQTGRQVADIASDLRSAAASLFIQRYTTSQPLHAKDVDGAILQAALLCPGVGAIYSPIANNPGAGSIQHHASPQLQVAEQFNIAVDIWTLLG